MRRIIAPSLLSADFLNLGNEIEMLNESSAEWIHCDIMDGHFVPNLTFGFPVLKQIRLKTTKILDVHLMISNAEQYIGKYIDVGADVLTLHFEAVTHLHRAVDLIKSKGVKAGVSLNPHTPVSVLEEIITSADMILLMSVNPGFGGQSFIPETIEKIIKLNEMRRKLHPECLIQVDGGVNTDNTQILFQSGVDVLVAGSAIFKSPDPLASIENMLNA